VVFNTGPYTVLPDNSILITANMQLETGFPSSHQLKSYVASKSRLKLAARAVLSADAGLLVQTVKSRCCKNGTVAAYLVGFQVALHFRGPKWMQSIFYTVPCGSVAVSG